LLLFISGHHCSSVFISVHQCSAVFIIARQRSLVLHYGTISQNFARPDVYHALYWCGVRVSHRQAGGGQIAMELSAADSQRAGEI
jgi:hypothetical protein